MNNVFLIGRLTRDPELRYTKSGIAVTKFTIAIDRYAREGEEKKADFIPVTVWRGQAEACAKYLVKGRLVAVSGRIQTGSYEKDDGTRVYTTDVVANGVKFLEWGDKAGGTNNGGGAAGNTGTESFASVNIDDDELPF